jgi:single-stranded-DNA-specific exonuclease
VARADDARLVHEEFAVETRLRKRLPPGPARAQGPGRTYDTIETDGDLSIDEIALPTAEALRAGGPWGQAFPEPSFDGEFLVHQARVVGARHLKLWVEPTGSGRRFDAIAFNHLDPGARPQPEGSTVRLVYRLDINAYRDERRLQLLIDHLLPVC